MAQFKIMSEYRDPSGAFFRAGDIIEWDRRDWNLWNSKVQVQALDAAGQAWQEAGKALKTPGKQVNVGGKLDSEGVG